MTPSSEAVWLYAVAGDDVADAANGLFGVDGEPVRTIRAAGLSAVVGSVALARFGEAALRRNLEDLEWLGDTARTHDAVIEAVAQTATIVPMRLATVYFDDARVHTMLNSHQDQLADMLRRLTGRTEWGVKAYAEAADPPQAAIANQRSTVDSNGGATGAAYLRRKRAQLAAREHRENLGHQQAQAVHQALSPLAYHHRCHPPQDPKLTGKSTAMVLNAAYLVDDDQGEAFTKTVVRLANALQGIDVELTGPWPPYSFAGIEGPDL